MLRIVTRNLKPYNGQAQLMLICENRQCGITYQEPFDMAIMADPEALPRLVSQFLAKVTQLEGNWVVGFDGALCPYCNDALREALREARKDIPRVQIANSLQQRMAEKQVGPLVKL